MRLDQRTKSAIALTVGIGAITALFAWRGLEPVAGFLEEAGLSLLLVCLFAIPTQVLGAESWRTLFPADCKPGRLRTLFASWMGSSVNTLLPVATIGGDIAKARSLILWGAPGAETAAAATVDKTIQAVAVLIWGLVGAAFLAVAVGPSPAVSGVMLGAGMLAIGIAGFIAIQVKGGISLIGKKITARSNEKSRAILTESVAATEQAIREIYGHPRRLILATACRVGQRVILAGEIVLVGYLMGVPIGFVEAVILKGLIGAIRGMAFAIPGGLGIQEGGYVAIGALIGQPPDLMIAVSLATRLREILPNIPLLFLWQITEGRAFWLKRRRKAVKEAGPR